MSTHNSDEISSKPFNDRVLANQTEQTSNLKASYDFIICGAGSSGSVIARRLAENPGVSVLLVEAGGGDEAASVTEAAQWPLNIGTERDWGFVAKANPQLNNRAMPLSMGKLLGGGSSINCMVWSRGHRNDWDHFANEAGDDAWNYQSVLDIYRSIEDWDGVPDATRRGKGGLVYVQPAPDPNPVAPALLRAAEDFGIPVFADQNGEMMEGDGGCALANIRVRNGKRLSIFRSYTYGVMDRPNLTVLTDALVTRIVTNRDRATGIELSYLGQLHQIGASKEVVVSLGAINTPKLLMQSGIGDETHLKMHGIKPVLHLPGVGQNFQDHVFVAGCIWEYRQPEAPRNNAGEATFFWKSDSSIDGPDLQPFQLEIPYTSAETASYAPPPHSWTLIPGLVRPKSRGQILLTGPDPKDPVEIDANSLAEPADLKALIAGVELCRELGNSAAMSPFAKREVMPGNVKGPALQTFVRNGLMSYWHQTCTAKMGRDRLSVVDAKLKVYGIQNLRVADGSILPRVTTGNTMAPCVVIGERAAQMIKLEHHI